MHDNLEIREDGAILRGGEVVMTSDEAETFGRFDGWSNFFTGMGLASRDKKESMAHTESREIQRPELDGMYRNDAIAARAVDIVPQDAVREGFDITIESADEDGKETDPKEVAGVIRSLESDLTRLGAKKKFRTAMKWARLYGGSLIIMGLDDATLDDLDNMAEPADKDSLQAVRWLIVAHRHQVTVGETDMDPRSPNFGNPLFYVINQIGTHGDGPALSNVVVHWTRALRFDGVELPPDISRGLSNSASNDGWGDSVLQRAYTCLRDFQSAYSATASLLQDFNQGVYKVKNLRSVLAGKGESVLMKRFQIMDMVRSVINAVIVDTEDESFDRIPTNVTGLDGILDRFGSRLSAAFWMPITILLGVSPGGFGTGEHETQNWDDVIKAFQEDEVTPNMVRLIACLMLSAEGPTKGEEPENWGIKHRPLRRLNPKEEAERFKIIADALGVLVANTIVSPEEAANSAFGQEDVRVDITLDKEAREAFKLQEGDDNNDGTGNGPPPPPTPTPDP